MPQYTPRRMLVKLSNSLWNELHMDDPHVYELVKSALYLGYGIESLRRLVRMSHTDTEVTEVLRVAPLMGMTEEDAVVRT